MTEENVKNCMAQIMLTLSNDDSRLVMDDAYRSKILAALQNTEDDFNSVVVYWVDTFDRYMFILCDSINLRVVQDEAYNAEEEWVDEDDDIEDLQECLDEHIDYRISVPHHWLL